MKKAAFFPMARPAARTKPAPPVVAVPPFVIKGAAGMLALIGLAFLLWKVDAHNDRLQAERRLAEDPALSGWFEAMQDEIATFERGPKSADASGKLAEAVWLGTVSRRTRDSREFRSPQLTDVTLSPAYLMAGRRSPRDESKNAVRISVMGFSFPRGEPQEGERWVFAVRRINNGHNVVRAAHPAP